LARLTTLDLGRNDIGPSGVQALAASPYLAGLKCLNLDGANIGNDGARVLAASRHLAQLNWLGINDNDIDDEGAEALATSPYLTRLTTLHHRGNRIGTRGAQALLTRFGNPLAEFLRVQSELAQLAENDPRRVELEARGRRLLAEYQDSSPYELPELSIGKGSRGAVAVIEGVTVDAVEFLVVAEALFQAAPHIQHLRLRIRYDVRGMGLPDVLQELASSPYLARLTTLDLSDNWINDTGAAVLSASPVLAHLSTLDLSLNRIGDAGAEALAASPHLRQLTWLVLRNNPIGDRGEQALIARFGRRGFLL
jgi:Ran GTPase-activating protein (RanGAP) involved in mRNA processing and transport